MVHKSEHPDVQGYILTRTHSVSNDTISGHIWISQSKFSVDEYDLSIFATWKMVHTSKHPVLQEYILTRTQSVSNDTFSGRIWISRSKFSVDDYDLRIFATWKWCIRVRILTSRKIYIPKHSQFQMTLSVDTFEYHDLNFLLTTMIYVCSQSENGVYE